METEVNSTFIERSIEYEVVDGAGYVHRFLFLGNIWSMYLYYDPARDYHFISIYEVSKHDPFGPKGYKG